VRENSWADRNSTELAFVHSLAHYIHCKKEKINERNIDKLIHFSTNDFLTRTCQGLTWSGLTIRWMLYKSSVNSPKLVTILPRVSKSSGEFEIVLIFLLLSYVCALTWVVTYVHWAKNPWRVIQPLALVSTELTTSSPQGIMGKILNNSFKSQIQINQIYNKINTQINNNLKVAHPLRGSSSTWFPVELEYENVGFWGEGKTRVPGEKPLGSKERTNNKLNPDVA